MVFRAQHLPNGLIEWRSLAHLVREAIACSMPATTRCRNASLASSSARISAIRKLVEPNRYQRSYGSLRARSLRASSFSATQHC